MLKHIRNVLSIPELRNRIALTLVLLAVYRLGFLITLPFVDQGALADSLKRRGDSGVAHVMNMLSLFSASNIGQMTIFGLGIMPYISASIIFQLLGTVYPPLEKLQKEGEAGRKKINEWTRYATVVICFFQSYFWISVLAGSDGDNRIILKEFDDWYMRLVCVVTMTTGSVLLMWIGEQIDEYGVGNGVSLLIMAGILSRLPTALGNLVGPAMTNGIALGSQTGIDRLIVLVAVFFGVVWWVVLITQAQRRIPVQSAKHVRGNKVYGGRTESLPLRLNASGVMPIIFASSLLMFPWLAFKQLAALNIDFMGLGVIFQKLENAFANHGGFLYNACYVMLIFFFCYFWTAIIFNPTEMASQLKDYGSFIPGYRPGDRTASYLERVMTRVTYVGAAFLSLVAVIPTVVSGLLNLDYTVSSFYGGTGLLICVSVAIDLIHKIDSYLVARQQRGLLDVQE
ncbi:preprotein translocase subunit SecY [Schlesneria paludicola]|uniref:preprotein translocase subunit SecY n=1 Tax=Schlesneria paludicola TaxID=360056 RepID=UPI00029ABB06|nr:preprotein translocase subunit SecY [Schlesneria paludicola]